MQRLPEILSTREIYKGKIFDVIKSEIRHDAIQYKREIVVHKGSAVILPVFADQTVALVRQYRYAAEKFLLEVPAGTLNKGEDPKLGAIRELEEEIGVRAANVELLTEFYVSPGFLTEKMFLFLATELTATKQNLEVDEILTIKRLSFPDAFSLIRNGEIQDAKTMIGLIMAGPRFGHIFQ
ncbi:MAG TPA: NUDIX hydrolase [Pyrinomonadaceae bacterium]|nr:NUDIX hydrolase [Pyrinomonadaceae bacterium]